MLPPPIARPRIGPRYSSSMHGGGPPRRQRSRSRDRDRDCRDDRERRDDDRDRGSHSEDRVRGGRRPDARGCMPDGYQRDDCRGRACGPRSGTDDGHGCVGPPRPSVGGRQVESHTHYYDSLAFQHHVQHQSRPEAMGMRDSGARRDESPRRHAEPWELGGGLLFPLSSVTFSPFVYMHVYTCIGRSCIGRHVSYRRIRNSLGYKTPLGVRSEL